MLLNPWLQMVESLVFPEFVETRDFRSSEKTSPLPWYRLELELKIFDDLNFRGCSDYCSSWVKVPSNVVFVPSIPISHRLFAGSLDPF